MNRIPLSQTQLGIFIECAIHKDIPMYEIVNCQSIDKEIDLKVLKNAITEALDAHSFSKILIGLDGEGMPYQYEKDSCQADIQVVKCSDEELLNMKKSWPLKRELVDSPLINILLIETPSGKWFYNAMSHIIFDGSSAKVLSEDINNLLAGKPIEQEALSIRDISEREVAARKTPAFQEAKDWYAATFGGIDADSLPIGDIDSHDLQKTNSTNRFVSYSIELNSSYEYAFKTSREVGVPLSILTNGVFGYVVGTFNSATQALFSTIYAGRKGEDLQRSISMLVKTLPVYTQWDKDTLVKDYFLALSKQQEGAKEHDIYSFAEAKSDLGFAADIAFCYRGSCTENAICISENQQENVKCYSTLNIASGMTCVLDHIGDKLVLDVRYDSERFSKELIKSFAAAYDCALSQVASANSLSEISLADEKEQLQKDERWFVPIPLEKPIPTIVDLFRAQSKRTPDGLAIVCGQREYSYGQIDDLSDRVASYLHSKGIGKGDVVAIIIPRDENMVIASLGVLKSGAAYQPLDYTYPEERLSFMVEDAQVKLLIADEMLVEKLSGFSGEVLLTKDIPALEKVCAEDVAVYAPKGEDLFILLYTSGSTGTPKGCRLLHSNLTSFVTAIQPMYNYGPSTKVAAYASYGFDANIFDIYPSIAYGGAIYVVEEEIRLDLVALAEYYEKVGITHAFMTTQVARAFATSVKVPECIKYLSCGGEALAPFQINGSYSLYNLYGPTEAMVFVTAQKVDRPYDRIPIGSAIPNVRLYVADKNGHLLPDFACGELWVAGPGVSAGYLNRPEKSAEAFIPNPFSDEENYRTIYRTGDLVRRLVDGSIDFLGRGDSQVKVRGFRIELSEVEAVVREFPGIEDATITAFDAPTGGKNIAAYVVSKEKVDVAALNAFIAEKKPPYMVPAVTIQIDKIPLTQNQKVDRRALPKPEIKIESSNGQAVDRAANPLEKVIKEIVEADFQLEQVDISTPLEYLGLTSISAIRLSVSLFKRFGVDIKSSELLGGATISSVADIILESWINGEKSVESAQVQDDSLAGQFPLTISQQGVYADSMRNPKSTSYNIPLLYRFPLSQDAQQLSEHVKTIFKAHPYLQTYFTLSGSDVEQVVSDDREVKVDLLSMTTEQFAQFKRGFVQPFNLLKGPLYRIAVVSTPEGVYLMIDIHHIIFDGTSAYVFMTELEALLHGKALTQESSTYHDYIRHELSVNTAHAKEFYREMLKECEGASEITPDLPQNANGEMGEREMVFEYLPFDEIQQYCKSEHITPAALTLAATGYVVSRFTGTSAAYLSTISSGRGNVHFSDSMGMFVKTLPIAVEMGDGSCSEFAKRTAAALSGCVENEIYPYSTICKDYNYAPNIVFEYQMGVERSIVVNGEKVERENFGSDTLKFKIAIKVEQVDDKPAVIVEYKNALYSKELMSTFVGCIVRVAKRMVEEPSAEVKKVSMLSAQDEVLLKQFEAEGDSVEAPIKLFHKMFEQQVDIAPDKEILVAADGVFTYSQLEERANRVANALIARGVQKGDCVVVLLHRTSNFFTTVFGVLKAGGVYIPTSPDYPKERINSIIEDSGAKVIITEDYLVRLYNGAVDVEQLNGFSDCSRPQIEVAPSDKVYMIYTSGSTGKPKGVELRHESICNYCTNCISNPQVYYTLRDGNCYGSVTTVAFDMSLKEWGVALTNGLKLVFASDEETLDPMALAKRMEENSVDVFNATPSRLLQYMEVESFAKAISHCKVILSGGEKYPSKLLSLLKENTSATIINTYGPTEITVSSNGAILTHTDVISVGRPLLNYHEYIVDIDDNPLPVGVVGELIICGIGVGSGYHNLPEQTSKAFITFAGQKAYRSGDYARWLKDGCVEILGRKDSQVKIRGLRIELGEIEKVLTSIEGIKSGTILIKKLSNQDAICAYYTLSPGASLTSTQIRDEMATRLTDYMVPTAFVELEQMPLTANGKINTRELPEPIPAERAKGRLPESDAEKLFAKIFADILELEYVYADDSFFDLGGTSLTVTRVIIAASKEGMDLAYADVFDNPTPEKLATLVKASGTSSQKSLYEDFEDISQYDYSAIDKLLEGNNLESFLNGERQGFSHILLTGATGFLGIHVLWELLHNYPDCKITCLLRSKGDADATTRLAGLFFYYFEESPMELFPDRLFVVEGDITQKESLDRCTEIGADLVVNCAANVKHFSKGTDIEDVNYYGVLNVIDYCKKASARLVHVSTMSVGGAFIGKRGDVTNLHENQLFYGQKQVSKYTQSKYLAERAILQAVADGELSAKIMRVGTLAPRNKDGEYQINFGTNSFMARMKSTYLVGAHSFESEIATFELSPIDAVAQAILLLATSPRENVVLHPFNNHQLLMGDLYDCMTSLGYPSVAVEEAQYQAALEEAEQDPVKARVLTGLLAYRQGHGLVTYNIGKAAPLTVAILSRLGFHWPMTSSNYTERFIVALSGLGFFEDNLSE